MSCSACHTVFPELTTYGRTFKLNGYTTTNTDAVKDPSEGDGPKRLDIDAVPPLSAMIQIADTFTKNPPETGLAASNQSDGNGSLVFPSQFSLFYAGRISPQMGAFVQVTYDSASGAFAFDNTDVRFADRTQIGDTDLVFGLTANNNPTVQDVFNSTPAWGFPYSGGNSAITPSAATQIESLGGSVGGLGAYVFWNQLLYAEVSAYRTAPQGGPAAADIQGYAPYWRVALTKDFDQNSVEIGAYGMDLHTYPDSLTPTGTADDLNDFAVDAQYQYVGTEHIFTLAGSCVWENQNWAYSNLLGNTTNATDTYQSLKADATYYYDRKIGATIGYFQTTGSNDTGLYSSTPAPGNPAFANNIPDSAGWVAELNYVPWYNTKFSLQYTLYNKFDGGTTNYDGAGRNASDNNTLMAMAWLMY
jgi:hypothetical protein